MKLKLDVLYNVVLRDFKITSDVQQGLWSEVLFEFLQFYKGPTDTHKANDAYAYNISITFDMADDSFEIISDTGNKGLTAGLIFTIVTQLDRGYYGNANLSDGVGDGDGGEEIR